MSGVFVSSTDFRQIANRAERGRADRLFRASVSAFCALPRPSRREIAQLEDLTLPLLDGVSMEAKRYVAAILSEVDHAPPELVRRLANETVAVAAPLLIRSRVLTDIDLIRVIGRHGLPHARAIARRADLNPTIADLIKALERPSLVALDSAVSPQPPVVEGATTAEETDAERVRERLRSMMLPPIETAGPSRMAAADRKTAFERLRSAALTGQIAAFQKSLAEALGLPPTAAFSILDGNDNADLILALRALDLDTEQAFLLVAAARPGAFGDIGAIRRFVQDYRICRPSVAREKVSDWRSEESRPAKGTTNFDLVQRPGASALRAS